MVKKQKLALTAALAVAMALTLSCSGGDDNNDGGNNNGGSNNNGGGGVPFNENSQVYKATHWDNDGVLHIDTYKGNGIIKISSCAFGDLIDGDCDEVPLNAGSVTNGIVKLELPTVPNEYLTFFGGNEEEELCTDYTQGDVKVFTVNDSGGFILTDSNGEYIGGLDITDGDKEHILYNYYSKDAKYTCNGKVDGFNISLDMNVKAGWNKIYTYTDWIGKRELKASTTNILTKEVKWVIYYDSEGSTPPEQRHLNKGKTTYFICN